MPTLKTGAPRARFEVDPAAGSAEGRLHVGIGGTSNTDMGRIGTSLDAWRVSSRGRGRTQFHVPPVEIEGAGAVSPIDR